MKIQVRRAEFSEIAALRELYRHELNCQVISDSILGRGMADPYLILIDGRIAGYAGVWNQIDPGRLMEFYLLPRHRADAQAIYRDVLTASRATQAQAQTNNPLMLTLLYDCATTIQTESILFHDAFISNLPNPGGTFRRAEPNDIMLDDSDWVIEANGAIVAWGGFLCHYNPPYGDVYTNVIESARGQGYGSFFVQEVKRVCYEAGKTPAARCNPTNVASRKTLQKAGFLPCGRMLFGDISPTEWNSRT